jgi:hypothetical protein
MGTEATCVQCEDCKFANWDATLFRDHEEGRWEGGHYIPPYNEQFDVYCIKHERFFMEQEITGDCQDGEYGPNNYHDVCHEHPEPRDEGRRESCPIHPEHSDEGEDHEEKINHNNMMDLSVPDKREAA